MRGELFYFDLNIAASEQDNNKDLDITRNVTSPSVLNFDLNHTPNLDPFAQTEEDKENEIEVEIHEAQPSEEEVIVERHFETEHHAEQSQPAEFDETQPILNSNGSAYEYQGTRNRRKFLSNDDRKAISRYLLQHSHNGVLEKGVKKHVASIYSVSINVIKRIWRNFKNTGDVSHGRTKNCGRKRVEFDHDQFRELPLSKKTTIRDLSFALNINKSSLGRLRKLGIIQRHTNAIKSTLKEDNKIARLKFCLPMLEDGTVPHDPTFKGVYNIVHIDVKWFYMTKKSMNYYLLPGEDETLRTCQNKNFIGKVMFLVAICRPRFDAEWNVTFSGKIGVYPFITKEPAQRTSANRVAGTLVTKPITSLNREVSRRFLIEKIIPDIKAKWPRDEIHHPIFIQQDNARCHIDENDGDFCRVAKEGFDIRLMCQSPNSPDLNVLDLGFFNVIQAMQHKEAPRTIDDLIGAVVKSSENFSPLESNKIFLTLQTCMVEIMKEKGSNKYNIPHIKKAVMQKEGRLPSQIKCDPSLVEQVIQNLGTHSD